MQEFIEAVGLYKFISSGGRGILSLRDAQDLLTYSVVSLSTKDTAEEGQAGGEKAGVKEQGRREGNEKRDLAYIPVSAHDHMLGMADFIGELMRTCPDLSSTGPSLYGENGRKELLLNMINLSQTLLQGTVSTAAPTASLVGYILSTSKSARYNVSANYHKPRLPATVQPSTTLIT
jgi:hypothetical protein